MFRADIRNHAFNRMGERFAPFIDKDHFLGQSAFDVPHRKDQPPANIAREGELFHLEIAVPGFAKEDLSVMIEGDTLTIRGKKSQEEKTVKPEYILEEFSRNSFERQFILSEEAMEGEITSKYDRGILTLTFNNMPKKSKGKTRKVEVA